MEETMEVAVRLALFACLALALALGLAACANPYVQEPRNERGATVKIVDAKRPPATLIAMDRSVCLVTAARYAEVRIGDAVYCRWFGGGDVVPGLVAPGTDDRSRGGPRS